MTAEIAILNKLGIALAADSAVTISSGPNNKKVFNTADKLFQLCCEQPIAAMISGGMEFSEAPLPILIKEFREKSQSFVDVEEASKALIKELSLFARDSSEEVQQRAVYRATDSLIRSISDQVVRSLRTKLSQGDEFFKQIRGEGAEDIITTVWEAAIEKFEAAIKELPAAKFSHKFPLAKDINPILNDVVDASDADVPSGVKSRLVKFLRNSLKKGGANVGSTGMVIAGYGESELFPTLSHFRLFEPVLGRLKYELVEHVDISRDGENARVMTFAQREMAERFLFGLDTQVKEKIIWFCSQTFPQLRKKISKSLEFADDDQRTEFEDFVSKIEGEVLEELEREGLDTIRRESRRAVEDMVEFMPKQDLAEFAEALVNLSSLQRRVTSGFETVGGPIDVAVISRAEGMVWVKRKHYFPPELNSRFFERIKMKEIGT